MRLRYKHYLHAAVTAEKVAQHKARAQAEAEAKAAGEAPGPRVRAALMMPPAAPSVPPYETLRWLNVGTTTLSVGRSGGVGGLPLAPWVTRLLSGAGGGWVDTSRQELLLDLGADEAGANAGPSAWTAPRSRTLLRAPGARREILRRAGRARNFPGRMRQRRRVSRFKQEKREGGVHSFFSR